MHTSQPTTLTKYPIGMREPRAFGVEDRPPCPSCGAEMHLSRRSPKAGDHTYEVQIFSCAKCDAEITRSETARRHSVTRSPRGGLGHRRSV